MDRHEYTIRYRESLPSTKHAMNQGVTAVLRIAGGCECPEEHLVDMEIALREALANAMIHGNAYGEDKRIFLRCYAAPGLGMVILVRDEGDGFDPDEIPDPRSGDRMYLNHGRGLFLMRELMDHAEYRRDGREVLLFKSCLSPPRAG
jgi:serine/threonine-protein kinase RsbW